MKKPSYSELFECPICLGDDKIEYLNFGLMPLVNNLNDTRDDSLYCKRYPLAVNYYPESKLSMLSVAIEPNILFSHYVYKSGTSQPYIDHCKDMYSHIESLVKINDGDKFLDIGGNDGTLLTTFNYTSNKNISLTNIDPSENLTKISATKGINTVCVPWDYIIASKYPNTFKVITSTNVFQHTRDIAGFVSGIANALTQDGIWCLEFPYWKHDLETNQYDQVYHEHIYYYLLAPLVKLFVSRGLEIIDVSEQKIHGGSLRVISRKNSPFVNKPLNDIVKSFLEKEQKFDKHFYINWGNKVKNHIEKSKQLISSLKKDGKKIVGFGAAAKGCTFLNAAEIDYNTIDYVIDDTDTKQGKFIPGTGIQIVPRQILLNDSPDYIVILAHNFADYIIKSLRPNYKGKFIVMFPNPAIL